MSDLNAFASAIPRPIGKQISTIYQIPIPNIQNGTFRFKFNVRISGNSYIFYLWYSTAWYISVTFPDTSIRTAAMIPNVTQWAGFSDYGLYPSTNLNSIGHNDLGSISLYMVAWK